RAISTASRTPKHMPMCSATRTCMASILPSSVPGTNHRGTESTEGRQHREDRESVQKQGRSDFLNPAFLSVLSSLCVLCASVVRSSSQPSRAGLAAALADDRFQVIQVDGKCLLAFLRQPARRLRPTADELLVDGDVAAILQLLQVNAEVAVGHVEAVAQLG